MNADGTKLDRFAIAAAIEHAGAGVGRSAAMLYQCVGILLSSSRNLVGVLMGSPRVDGLRHPRGVDCVTA